MTRIMKISKTKVSVQTIAAILSIAAAVALPQAFHAIGAVSGLGAAVGETFLPMHLPTILTGFIAGPIAGAVSGALAPILSLLLTGMPSSVMLPFMVIELLCYGLFAGFLRDVKLPCIVKLIIVQAAARLVRAGAILLAVNAFSYEGIKTGVILTSIVTGLPGLILQWALIPLIIYRINGSTNARKRN